MSESRNISYGFLSRTKNMFAAILFVTPLIFFVEGYIQENIVITKCKLKKIMKNESDHIRIHYSIKKQSKIKVA